MHNKNAENKISRITMKENVVRDKSFHFALRIIRLYTYLSKNKKEYTLSKQLLRSGTSIGANIEEATGGQTKKDFIAKMAIAYKEGKETEYWLRLFLESGLLTQKEFDSIIIDLEEVLKLLTAIQKTAKKGA